MMLVVRTAASHRDGKHSRMRQDRVHLEFDRRQNALIVIKPFPVRPAVSTNLKDRQLSGLVKLFQKAHETARDVGEL